MFPQLLSPSPRKPFLRRTSLTPPPLKPSLSSLQPVFFPCLPVKPHIPSLKTLATCSRGHSLSRNCESDISPVSPYIHKQRTFGSVDTDLERFRAKRLKNQVEIQDRDRKKRLVGLLFKYYQVKFSRIERKNYTMQQLVQKAVNMWAGKVGKKAAKRMIQWYHTVIIQKQAKIMQYRSHLAAFRIQIHWQKYKLSVLEPQKDLKIREKAAIVIQKWFRGHLIREKYRKRQLFRRINHLHFHYQRLRSQLLCEKASIIAKSWKEYKSRQQKKAQKTADIFKTSVKAPPMRLTVPRPGQLLMGGKRKRANTDQYETKSPDSFGQINTRDRAGTDPMNQVRTSKGSVLKLLRDELPPEPNTEPVPERRRRSSERVSGVMRANTRRVTKPLEKIVEIS